MSLFSSPLSLATLTAVFTFGFAFGVTYALLIYAPPRRRD